MDSRGKRTVSYILDEEFSRISALKEKYARIAKLETTLQDHPAALRIYTYIHKIAAAGTGFNFDDITTDTIEALYLPDSDFIVGVNDNSMEPTFSDGDMVYVHKCQIIETGDIGIFTCNNQCLIKEVGEKGLISHNPGYSMIPKSADIICIGKVLGKVSLREKY